MLLAALLLGSACWLVAADAFATAGNNDIRDVHDTILSMGSVPLLEQRIDRFIAAGGPKLHPPCECEQEKSGDRRSSARKTMTA